MKKSFSLLAFSLFLFVIFVIGINVRINNIGSEICDHNIFHKQAALVLGAKVWDNGEMSDIFKDRVKTAYGLYKNNQVEKILVSGDHGRQDYDEVNAAKVFLLNNGVQPEDIFLDHAGFDTYDSLYRAKHIFQAESIAVITQNFHLSRALYIAKKLGIDSCGVSADLHTYRGEASNYRREVLAKVKAWFNVVLHSQSKYLGKAIPLSGSGLLSWD